MERMDVLLALSVVSTIPAVFASAPALATLRGADDQPELLTAERTAVLLAGTVVVLAAGASGSPIVAVVGAVMVGAYACAYRQARRSTPGG